MRNLIILGTQWGDEGKGKLVDLMADTFDIIARFQGGHNAGHTIQIRDRKFVLKLIPSGILRPGKTAVIGNGMVIDPIALFQEIDQLTAAGVDVARQLRISNRAHILFPGHRAMEARLHIGTTKRGIGPCYEDKAGRRGMRVADLLDSVTFTDRFEVLAKEHETLLRAFGIEPDYSVAETIAIYSDLAERMRPIVTDTAVLLNRAIREGQSVLFEGAQATMLDIDHGTYPFVTSSSASAGGACIGTGVAPTLIDSIVGVAKAYITRVGGGPFPTESLDAEGDELRRRGNEYGSVTGRPRRCGWFDAPLLRYTAMVNNLDSLVITKLDVLDHLDSIPVCTTYRAGSEVLETMPAISNGLAEIEPAYECLPGWQTDTSRVRSWSELPAAARSYLDFLEAQAGVEVGCVSIGPERDQTLIRPGSKYEKLLA